MDTQHSPKYKPELAKYCDHTVLKAYTKREAVADFCDEAILYKAASVCVNPCHVAFVKEKLNGTGVKTCTVIGFPLGAATTAVKAFEAADAVENGADELDMVINVGALRDGDTEAVYEDILGVVRVACGKALVKVIVETCYLTEDELAAVCRLCEKAGADYVKTSSGFGTRGASLEDLAIMQRTVGDTMKIKASTGILTQEDAVTMVEAGASRLGLSTLLRVIEGDDSLPTASTRNIVPKG